MILTQSDFELLGMFDGTNSKVFTPTLLGMKIKQFYFLHKDDLSLKC